MRRRELVEGKYEVEEREEGGGEERKDEERELVIDVL